MLNHPNQALTQTLSNSAQRPQRHTINAAGVCKKRKQSPPWGEFSYVSSAVKTMKKKKKRNTKEKKWKQS